MKKNLIKITRIEIGFGFAVAGFLVPLIFLLYFFGRYLGEILWAILTNQALPDNLLFPRSFTDSLLITAYQWGLISTLFWIAAAILSSVAWKKILLLLTSIAMAVYSLFVWVALSHP